MYRSINSFKKDWVKALRSGEYRQAKHRLVKKGQMSDSFCCLGVAADLLVLAGHPLKWDKTGRGLRIKNKESGVQSDSLLAAVSPDFLSNWLLESPKYDPYNTRQQVLVQANDSGKKFDTIADMIAKGLE